MLLFFVLLVGSLKFTDDTAMARSIAASLIEHNGELNARDMAKRYNMT